MQRHTPESNPFSIPYSSFEKPERARQRLRRRAFSLGIVATVAAAGIALGVLESRPESAPTPQELHLSGSITMNEFSQSLAQKIETGEASATKDSTGVDVVPLSEFTATPGTKATNNNTELAGRPLSTLTSPELQKHLSDVVSNDADLLNTVVENGSLATVRFNMAIDPSEKELNGLPDGDVRFIPAKIDENGKFVPAVVEYTLPATGEVSLNVMAGMVRHEVTHIWQRSLDVVDKTEREEGANDKTYVDTGAYRQDIARIRKASIAAAEQDPRVIEAATKVLTVNEVINTPVAEAERKIARSILDGTFIDLQPTADRPSKLKDFEIDEGRINEPDFVEAFDSGLTDAQLKETTPQQAEAMHELAVAFDKGLYENPSSPLSILDESAYFEGRSEFYGHPHSNTAELLSSSHNVMRSYPRQLAVKLKQLPTSVKEVVVRFLERVNSDTSRARGVKSYGNNKAAQQLRDKNTATLSWIKEQSSKS